MTTLASPPVTPLAVVRGTASARTTTILPRTRWATPNLGEAWAFRSLLGRLVRRDLTLRYRQTALGVVWVVLQPLFAAGVFGLVFGSIAKLPSGGVPYYVFSFCGLLGWSLFSAVLGRASGSLVGNQALVAKVYFPRLLLPLSSVGSAFVDFLVALVVMAILLVANGIHVGLAVLTLPLWVALTLGTALGAGMFLSALCVRYRDVNYVLPIVIQFLLYGSPVAYALSTVPAHLRFLFDVNPLTGILEGYRWALLGGPFPGKLIIVSVGVMAALLIVGLAVFAREERRFADVI